MSTSQSSILVINKAMGHRGAHGGEYFREPEIIALPFRHQ